MTDRAPPPPRRTRLAAALILLLTFALGMAAGVGLAPMLRRPPLPLPPSFDALHLRLEQRARIEAIIARHGAEVDAAIGDAMPRLRAIQERVASEIAAELDPDQRDAFERERARHPPPPLP